MPRRLSDPFSLGSAATMLERQAGVVTRRQLLDAGAAVQDIRRMLSRGELVAWAPGVYLDHGGTPTWLQRAWGAVLLCWPAALAGDSALRAEAGPGWRGRPDSLPIQVAIDVSRRVRRGHSDVEVRRVTTFDERTRWHMSPPRMRFEEAALDSALAADRLSDGVEALARAIRSRRTTPDRLLSALEKRSKVAGRADLVGILTDLRDGTSSILERGYLVNVERAHALPRGTRQTRERTVAGVVYRDVDYEDHGVCVELDGRVDHLQAAERSRDLRRDLDLAASGRVGIRLGWSQVFDSPCTTADAVGRLLATRGWIGRAQPCGRGCSVEAVG